MKVQENVHSKASPLGPRNDENGGVTAGPTESRLGPGSAVAGMAVADDGGSGNGGGGGGSGGNADGGGGSGGSGGSGDSGGGRGGFDDAAEVTAAVAAAVTITGPARASSSRGGFPAAHGGVAGGARHSNDGNGFTDDNRGGGDEEGTGRDRKRPLAVESAGTGAFFAQGGARVDTAQLQGAEEGGGERPAKR